MTDPYKVLGVSRDATDDEIKKAYRDMAKKYHPDNFVNSPSAALAEEKMKEINQAYDEIKKNRSGKREESNTGYGGNYDARETYDKVRRMINEGRISEAESLLSIFAVTDRGAEWNFLMGCVLVRRGYFYDAQKYFETACYMEPGNEEYRRALENIRTASERQNERAQNTEETIGNLCNCCETLMCLNCCCNCFGGDLFRCG